MLQMSVRDDFQQARGALLGLADEVPRATARALNDTGFAVRKALQDEMRAVFDRPTPWALNAYVVVKATPRNLTALVSAQERAVKSVRALAFLGPQIEGGPRLAKRSERRLRAAGILGPDEFVVPGAGADLDQYGNIKPSQMQKILANVRAHGDSAQRTRAGAKTEYFYPVRRGGQLAGIRAIWRRRKAGTVVPALMIVRAPVYKPRLAARRVAEATLATVWPREFGRQLGTRLARA